MHEITIEDLHGIQFATVQFSNMICCLSIGSNYVFVGTNLCFCGNPAFVGTMFLAALWRDGKELLWPSGGGPLATSLVVVLMLQDGKD